MKERGMIFNTEMVQAIQDGRKTVTRRPVKGVASGTDLISLQNGYINAFIKTKCPYGQPGDLIYVRETCSLFDYDHKTGAPLYVYRADEDEEMIRIMKEDRMKWRPSIHMPKSAARIWLEITDVRVERVQDIKEEQAEAEGIISQQDYYDRAGEDKLFPCPECDGFQTITKGSITGSYEAECKICDSPKKRFGILWDSIYGNWKDSPWVWVIEFKRVEI